MVTIFILQFHRLAFNSLPDLGVELSVPNYPKGRHPYLQCSGKGLCNLATGQCKCFKGFHGNACERQDALAVSSS